MAMIWWVVLTFCRFAQNLYVSKYGFRQEEWSANQGNPFSNLNTPRPDSRELKRERDRAQSASLTHQEQKNERKRRHHGAYRMKNGITMRAESEISQQHTIDLTGMNPILPPSCLNKPTQCLTCSFFGSTHRDRSAVPHWW